MDILPNFVDLARTPEEIQDKATEMQNPAAAAAPVYPYGLCICLDKETLDKLDLDDEASVGDIIHMHCLGRVTSVSKRDTDKGPDCRIEIQITGIALEDEDEENEEAEEKMPASSSVEMARKAYGKK